MAKAERNTGAASRTLEILRCIALGEPEFALNDLAERSGLAASTAHRLIDEWVRRDLVQRAGPKAYRIGPELFRLASLIAQRFETARVARGHLEWLARAWDETTLFCLFNPATRTATVAESIPCPHPLKYEIPRHSEVPLAWGSLGRAVLAHLSVSEIDAALGATGRGPLSGKALPARRVMLQELERIRKVGYAVYADRRLDVAGVSAPVLLANARVIGSVGVIMPASRFSKRVERYLPSAVTEVAKQLATALLALPI